MEQHWECRSSVRIVREQHTIVRLPKICGFYLGIDFRLFLTWLPDRQHRLLRHVAFAQHREVAIFGSAEQSTVGSVLPVLQHQIALRQAVHLPRFDSATIPVDLGVT